VPSQAIWFIRTVFLFFLELISSSNPFWDIPFLGIEFSVVGSQRHSSEGKQVGAA